MNLKIVPQQVTKLLIFITLTLACASLAGQVYRYFLGDDENILGLVKLFNLDNEYNFPTLYSGLLLLLCSIMFALIALTKHKDRNRYAFHWQGLSIIFLYLSFDEWLGIHEKINPILNKAVQSAPSKQWDVLNLIFLFIFLVVYVKFFIHLPAKMKKLFILGGSLFVVGAFAIEVVGVHFLPNIYHQKIFMAEIITTIEESLEMIGVIIFIYALLSYMSCALKNIHINIVYSKENGNNKTQVATIED